ncbi:MAG: cytochrome c maturation protein CcmE [Gemmatimonadales bacterium]|nr:MAG: cytochrome c maturation protein CcmE [Gemmatimonadales bacterium]
MAKNGRFMVGLVGVAAVVTYLIWTGVSDTMVYYLTPTELEAKITADPTFKEVGVKVSGRVVPGSHEEAPGELLHRFVIHDVDSPDVTMTIEYRNVLPDTFSDSESMTVDAVVEGRFREDGVFEAKTVLTKCGSRYEATPEELAAG